MPSRSGPPDPRAALDEGVARFNAAEYFEAHEAFEELWRAASGETRPLYQGLVQVCAGLVKHGRGEPRSAVTLVRKGLDKLEAARPDPLPELRLEDLIAQLRMVLRALESGLPFPPPAMRRAGGI